VKKGQQKLSLSCSPDAARLHVFAQFEHTMCDVKHANMLVLTRQHKEVAVRGEATNVTAAT
jgi:hypothetical protein